MVVTRILSSTSIERGIIELQNKQKKLNDRRAATQMERDAERLREMTRLLSS